MNDGITWIASNEISWLGHCITLARDVEPEELVSRLARNQEPEALGQHTGYDLQIYLDRLDREQGRCDSIAVRYGASGGLSFAVADGQWPGYMGPGYTEGLSRDGAHVFQLYDEQENPKLPPPTFSYLHDDRYVCGFDMYMHTWSSEIKGSNPELLHDDILAAGIPDETDSDAAHAKSLALVESRFQLTLPKELVLHGELPAALIR